MSDRNETMEKTAEAILLLSTALKVAAELTNAALSIQQTIERARAEGRDITDSELEGARAESALADLRFQQAVAGTKA